MRRKKKKSKFDKPTLVRFRSGITKTIEYFATVEQITKTELIRRAVNAYLERKYGE